MDVEKTMQFILEQQAQLTAHSQETEERIRQLGERIRKLVDVQAGQLEILTGHQTQIDQLIKSQLRTDEAINSLAEQGRHTDERLNALIKVVDDLIRRNGSPKKR